MGGRGSKSAHVGVYGRQEITQVMRDGDRWRGWDSESRLHDLTSAQARSLERGGIPVIDVREQREYARERLASARAPRQRDLPLTISVGERTVWLSRSRPGWSPDGDTRARYAVRYDSGVASNTEYFDGTGGWAKAKRYASDMLGLGR